MPLKYKTFSVNIAGGQDDSDNPQLLPLPKTILAENSVIYENGALHKRVGFQEDSELATPPGTYTGVLWADEIRGQRIVQTQEAIVGTQYPQQGDDMRAVNVREIAMTMAGDSVDNLKHGYRLGLHACVWIEDPDLGASNDSVFVALNKNGATVRPKVRLIGLVDPIVRADIAVLDEDTAYVVLLDDNSVAWFCLVDTTTNAATQGCTIYSLDVVNSIAVTEGPPGEVFVWHSHTGSTLFSLFRATGLTGNYVINSAALANPFYYANLTYDADNDGTIYVGGGGPARGEFFYTQRINTVDTTPGAPIEVAHNCLPLSNASLALDVQINPGTVTVGGSGDQYFAICEGSNLLYVSGSYKEFFRWDFNSTTLIRYHYVRYMADAGTYSAKATFGDFSPWLAAGPITLPDGDLVTPFIMGEGVGFSQGTLSLWSDDKNVSFATTGHLEGTAPLSLFTVFRRIGVSHMEGSKVYVAYLRGERAALTDPKTGQTQVGSFTSKGIRIAEFDFTPEYVPRINLPNGAILAGGSRPLYHDGVLPFPLNPRMTTIVDAESTQVGIPPGAWTTSTGSDNVVVDAVWSYLLPSGEEYRIVSQPFSLLVGTIGDGVKVVVQLVVSEGQKAYTDASVQFRMQVEGELYYSSVIHHGNSATTVEVSGWIEEDESAKVSFPAVGELDPVHYPPTNAMVVFNNSIWVVDATKQKNIFRTKPIEAGLVPELSSELIETLPYDIKALAVMDSKLIVFGSRNVGFFAGNGEDFKGTGAGYKFNQLPDIHGPISQAVIVTTPQGIIYERSGTFHKLLRNLTVETDIGPRLLAGESIVDSLYSPHTWEAYFVTQSKIYIYNTHMNIWTTANLGDKSLRGVFLSEKQGEHLPALVTTDGEVLFQKAIELSNTVNTQVYTYQDADMFRDVSTVSGTDGYTQRIITGWLPLNELTGYAALRRLDVIGNYFSEHIDGDTPIPNPSGLVVELAYNYDTSVIDTFSWTGAELQDLAANNKLRLRIRPSKRKCEAVQITLRETLGAPSDGPPGFSITGLAFEVGLKYGSNKQIPLEGKR